ncbi:MAG: conjugative transposon protein TraJ [Sphingobacterium sp.]|jgi:conjugative transposon TraJ protein|nr:conjugative transposon protein TraJ [Sphingobacterium sp.]
MKTDKLIGIATVTLFIFPICASAQGLSDTLSGMQSVLDRIYDEMLPLSSRLIDVARGIAGFGALWYIASRVWRQLASAEPLDFYPLLRPFALGLAIALFPVVLSVLNAVLGPTVSATSAMVKDSNTSIEHLLKQKEIALKKTKNWQIFEGQNGAGNREEWYKMRHPNDKNGSKDKWLDRVYNDMQFWMDKQMYSFRNSIKAWLKEVLEVVYLGASLCINTLRTFFLIVLAVIGPLALGFSVYDGFQQTLSNYLSRYINIFLWLPISNIFGSILGKIQENMLRLDLSQIEASGDTFFSTTDTAYLVFLLIGIVGFFSVPTVASYIVQATGQNTYLQRINTLVVGAGQFGASNMDTSMGKGSVGAMATNYGKLAGQVYNKVRDSFSKIGSDGDKDSNQRSKLEGK